LDCPEDTDSNALLTEMPVIMMVVAGHVYKCATGLEKISIYEVCLKTNAKVVIKSKKGHVSKFVFLGVFYLSITDYFMLLTFH